MAYRPLSFSDIVYRLGTYSDKAHITPLFSDMCKTLIFVDMTYSRTMVLTLTYSDSFRLRHVIDSHINGHDTFDSFLLPLIFRQGPSSFLLRHDLDSQIRRHDVLDSFLITLIVGHGPRSFLLRHDQDSKDFYFVDMSSTPLPH
jgi:hypothetical protein